MADLSLRDDRASNFHSSHRNAVAKERISIVDLLFAFSILIYPANAAVALDLLGEARSEPYILINLAIFPFAIIALYRRGLRREPTLALFMVAFLAAIALSALVNIQGVLTDELKGRSGLSRLVTTTMVPVFGFYFAYLVSCYSQVSFRRHIMGPLFWGAVIVIGVGDVELVSWKVDAVYSLFLNVSQVIHALMRRGEFIVGRVQSITAEASNFGMYAIFTLPWLWAFANLFRSPIRRILCWLMMANLIVLSVFSGRTSLVGIAPVIAIIVYLKLSFGVSKRFYLVCHHALMAGFLALNIIPIIVIAVFQDEIALAALSSDNVSNVSRFGTMAVQINEFMAYPIFGVGMGQYAFHVADFFPSWAYTWEFKNWISSPEASFYPSFSLYSRLAAELGMVGYLVWLAFSFLLLRNVMLVANGYYRRYGVFPYIGAAIICGFFGLQFSGWVIASYKIPYIWFVFGFAVAYLKNPEFIVAGTGTPALRNAIGAPRVARIA